MNSQLLRGGKSIYGDWFFFGDALDEAIKDVNAHDFKGLEQGMVVRMRLSNVKPPTTRILINDDGSITARRVDIDTDERNYPSVNKLPQWMKDKLAVLNIFPDEAYDKGGSYNERIIDGVGRKISRNIFWLEHNT